MENKKKLIIEMFEKGLLLNKDLLEQNEDESFQNIEADPDVLVLNPDYTQVIKEQKVLVDWQEVDKYRVEAEKKGLQDNYQLQLEQLKKIKLNPKQLIEEKEEKNEIIAKSSVTTKISFVNDPYKYTINDFANIFRSRYRFLESLLRNRQELKNILTAYRISNKKEKEIVSLIGLVEEISFTKNGHMIITLEDLTGKIKVLISQNNPELLEEAKELVVDEVIGILGMSGDKIIFAEKIIWPDLPANHELKKGENDEAAIFLSDIHYGSKVFLGKEFDKFLNWIKGDGGSEEQKELAKKVKYVFIAGDLVDGVGEYPSQEETLEIKDICQQYDEVVKLIKQIPADKEIIICPGNHDVVHLAEPQPVIYKEYIQELFNLPNITLVSNPALINIGKTETFCGFDVLLYHGFSFDYYVANVESIRNNGGYHRADLIMKFLLKRRHLAPSFKSTPYFPGHKEDPLLIKTVPDFFLTGHIHYSKVANYKNVTMICGSCWQGMTSFQEKMGHDPEPGRVPLVNLKTREIKVLKFI